jgi:hypothetical protein
MDAEYQNERFVTLRLKESVVNDFRKFCRKEGASQSVTLSRMLAYFERNQMRPGDEVPDHHKKVERSLLQRLNTVIGIIKDIEKNQTKPAFGMMAALFEALGFGEEKKRSKREETQFDQKELEEELKKLQDMGLE